MSLISAISQVQTSIAADLSSALKGNTSARLRIKRQAKELKELLKEVDKKAVEQAALAKKARSANKV